MVHLVKVCLCALLATLAANSAFAWGAQGHQVIAHIAQTKLSKNARLQIDHLLAQEPGATLETVATWADEHRSPATGRWHYINFPRDSCTYDAIRDCPDGQCIVAAIDAQTAILAGAGSDGQRLKALKYVVHLVGDVHQPLHAGYRDDKGGNTYQLQSFMRSSNLHALWDSGLIRYLDQDTLTLSRRLLAASRLPEPPRLGFAQAAEESCSIVALPEFYPRRKVGLQYVEHFTPMMLQRLALAGARLAAHLNQIFAKY